MELFQPREDEGRTRLLQAARAMVLRGDEFFSINALCEEAGVDRAVFRAHFSSRISLVAALMRDQTVSRAPAPSVPKAESGPSVSAPDEWLERRLRVFERALNTLEAKSDTAAREQARAIAELQERLGTQPEPIPEILPEPESKPEAEAEPDLASLLEKAVAALEPELPFHLPPAATPVSEISPIFSQGPAADAPQAVAEPAPQSMADVLPFMRKEKPLPEPDMAVEARDRIGMRMRWLAAGALALVAAFVGAGLFLGRDVVGTSAKAEESDGVARRHVAATPLNKNKALADAGDARAQARLALAYLRGQGSAGDANAALLWTISSARAGNPFAQYLLGALYQQGEYVKADPALAFAWFSRAAEQGNLKGMHNLAIAYAQGLGTEKDEAKAAEWFTRAAEHGYVDSAFDLAVLYERGAGVPQDLKQALKWYGIAALAGDQPSKERADFLRGQMKAADVKLATNAAMGFSPLPAAVDANSL